MIILNNKITTLINLSNQANLCKTNKTDISQFNFVVLIGLKYLRQKKESPKIPVSININKDGEMEIGGIDVDTLMNENNVKIYTDKKITRSEK